MASIDGRLPEDESHRSTGSNGLAVSLPMLHSVRAHLLSNPVLYVAQRRSISFAIDWSVETELIESVSHCGLPSDLSKCPTGRPHSGLDDCFDCRFLCPRSNRGEIGDYSVDALRIGALRNHNDCDPHRYSTHPKAPIRRRSWFPFGRVSADWNANWTVPVQHLGDPRYRV